MVKAKAYIYDYHKDYAIDLDTTLLNMKIRIYGCEYKESGLVYYEGPIGRFIRERIPSDAIVELLPQLKKDKMVSYTLGSSENFIERID